ncbi:MAG: hypothetical protein M3Q60_23560 [Actinomycetota bacterium]|nr:hypothetical protein [Actinomycetota bacterium]
MSIRGRLRRLEEHAPSAPAPLGQDLEDYFAALAGELVEERRDPDLEDYFAELEEHERRSMGSEDP